MKFQHFFESSSNFMCIANTKGYFEEINPAFQRFLGRSKEEIISIPYINFVHPKDRAKSCKQVDQYLQKEKFEPVFENRYLDHSGTYKWLRWTSVKQVGDLLYAVATEITDQKELAHSINDTKEMLSQIINLVPHPIFLKDRDGKYILVNEAQATLFSTTIEEIIGKDDSYFISEPLEIEGIRESDRYVLIRKESINLPEQVITHSNGKIRILNTTKIPFTSENGDMKILGVSIDMTDLKKTETELLRTNFELDSFVYKSSHDLRAPLRSIIGLLDLMKKEKDCNVISQSIDHAKKSVKTLDSFILDLTNFSRNNRTNISVHQIKFSKIIDECQENLLYMEDAGRITIIKDFEHELEFRSDEQRIKIIMMNLISNAIKYQRKDGIENPYLRISIQKTTFGIKIIVKDNGVGIEKEYQSKIFEMFFRASESSFGSGLGLYIVNQIVEKLDGHIGLESAFGIGTEFTISLPEMNDESFDSSEQNQLNLV
ncbi:MAG: PAS domain S-box protein [Cytophagaceae bacterium]